MLGCPIHAAVPSRHMGGNGVPSEFGQQSSLRRWRVNRCSLWSIGVALLPPSGARSDRKLLDNPETQILSMIPAPLVSILMDSARVLGCCFSNYVAYF